MLKRDVCCPSQCKMKLTDTKVEVGKSEAEVKQSWKILMRSLNVGRRVGRKSLERFKRYMVKQLEGQTPEFYRPDGGLE